MWDEEQNHATTIVVARAMQGTIARPLDGDVLSHGRARTPARGPAAAPTSLSSGRQLLLLYAWLTEKGREKEEEVGWPDLLQRVPFLLAGGGWSPWAPPPLCH
jgi:hypothetical protein